MLFNGGFDYEIDKCSSQVDIELLFFFFFNFFLIKKRELFSLSIDLVKFSETVAEVQTQ